MRYVFVVLCSLGFGGLLLAVFLASDSSGPDEDFPRPTLTVWHERVSSAGSRCDDCLQLGDSLKASLRGLPDTIHGLAIYHGDYGSLCFRCDDLSATVDRLGRYSVIGFQMRPGTSCALPRTGRDGDVAALVQCGVSMVEKDVDVR